MKEILHENYELKSKRKNLRDQLKIIEISLSKNEEFLNDKNTVDIRVEKHDVDKNDNENNNKYNNNNTNKNRGYNTNNDFDSTLSSRSHSNSHSNSNSVTIDPVPVISSTDHTTSSNVTTSKNSTTISPPPHDTNSSSILKIENLNKISNHSKYQFESVATFSFEVRYTIVVINVFLY